MQGDMKLMKCIASNFSKKKIIITGGTGFIGKRVVDLLASNNISCYIITRNNYVDHNNIFYIKEDLNKLTETKCRSIIKKYGTFDAAIYLAANISKIGEKKENYMDANFSTLVPLVNFMEGFSPYIEKVVYTSSIDVIGTPEKKYYDETEETNPISPYALAKLCGEYYIKSITSKYEKKYCILRLSQVYGEFEPMVRVIPILLKTIKEGKVFSIYGKGEEKRCFLYVNDAAEAIFNALNYNYNDVFNIAGKSVDSINDLINIVKNIYGKDLKLNQTTSSIKIYDNIPSIEKAKKVLGFEPRYSLQEGIQKIYEVESNGIKTI